jgi:hypothetical protein
MSKKIALVLILVLLANMSLWAEEFAPSHKHDDTSFFEEWGWIILVGLGAIVLYGVLFFAVIADADAPDDGIRMVSSEDEESPSPAKDTSIMDVLQHVQAGPTPDGGVFVGARFQF